MTATELLVGLAAAGVSIDHREGWLVLKPLRQVPVHWVAELRRLKNELIDLLEAKESPASWPLEWQDHLAERIAIMVEDGRISEAQAERQAIADVWRGMEQSQAHNSGSDGLSSAT